MEEMKISHSGTFDLTMIFYARKVYVSGLQILQGWDSGGREAVYRDGLRIGHREPGKQVPLTIQ